MWKNRLAYGCLAGILAILLFFSGKSFLLVALLLSLLLIPVFGILIRRDGKRIKIRLEKEKPVAAAIYSKGALRVADRVQIELEVKNEMFDRSECLQFLLPLKGTDVFPAGGTAAVRADTFRVHPCVGDGSSGSFPHSTESGTDLLYGTVSAEDACTDGADCGNGRIFSDRWISSEQKRK